MMKVLTGIYTRDAGTLYGWGKKRHLPGRNLPRKPGLDYPSRTEPDPAVNHCRKHFLGREFVNRFGKIDWKTMYAERINCWLNLTCALKATSWWAIFHR